MTHTDNGNRAETIGYHYDGLGRWVDTLMVYNAAGDTATQDLSVNTRCWYIFRHGDQVLTKAVSRDYKGDTRSTTIVVYDYDADHHLVRSYSNTDVYMYSGLHSYADITKIQNDSISYSWTDGNLMQAKDLTGRGSTVTYSYDPTTTGWSRLNVPMQATRWINNADVHCVPSKNLYTSSISTNSAGQTTSTSRVTYSLDDAGRITTRILYVDNTLNNRLDISYECH